eukprot:GILI01044247.1.p1 GENE.GILI01044247.1~~GILI01044247.1.p1  ORF type:complete len:126 (-),score=20.77 GILI01044247.1:43-420(-)
MEQPAFSAAAITLATDTTAQLASEGSLLVRLGPGQSSASGGVDTSMITARRRQHQEALLHAQMTRERLNKMEAMLRQAEPTFERIPSYVEKLRIIRKSMNSIEESVRTMRRNAGEIYQHSGLERK